GKSTLQLGPANALQRLPRAATLSVGSTTSSNAHPAPRLRHTKIGRRLRTVRHLRKMLRPVPRTLQRPPSRRPPPRSPIRHPPRPQPTLGNDHKRSATSKTTRHPNNKNHARKASRSPPGNRRSNRGFRNLAYCCRRKAPDALSTTLPGTPIIIAAVGAGNGGS